MNKPGRFRWVICGLLFFATLINYLDREILSILKPHLSQEMGWTDPDYARIANWFQAAYALSQMAFGPILAWLGTRSAFVISIIVWSLAAMGSGLSRTVGQFCAARFALGVGEGGNFPGCIRAVAEWFPQRERSVATGWFNTGSSLGKVVAPLLVLAMYNLVGWRMSFVILGATGFIWLIFWLMLFQTPRKSTRVTPAEIAHIETADPMAEQPAAADSAADEKVAWVDLLRYPHTWAYVFTGIMVGPVWWFYGFWLPDIFSKTFGLDLKGFGLPLSVVAIGAVAGSIGGGMLSPWLMRRGFSLNAARKLAALTCAVCTVPVLLVPSIAHKSLRHQADALVTQVEPYLREHGSQLAPADRIEMEKAVADLRQAEASPKPVSNAQVTRLQELSQKSAAGIKVELPKSLPLVWAVWFSTLIFAFATGAHQGWSATMYTVVSDIFPKNAVASIIGLGGAIAAGASMWFTWFVGEKLKNSGKYDLILYLCGGAYVLALLVFHLVVPRIQKIRIRPSGRSTAA